VRPSPLLSTAAAVALVGGLALPAGAATQPAPARGVGSSSLTLLGVTAGGHSVSAGSLELLSDMLGAEAVAKILATPLTADGKAYGQQAVSPGNAPGTLPSVSTSVLPALDGLVGVTSPALKAAARITDGQPATSAGATSLGSVSVLGLPVALDGSLDVGSSVTRAEGAASSKTVTVENLALPSVADLLGALGLDLSALPIDVLTELLTALDLVNGAVADAQQALDDAIAALGIRPDIDAAQAEVDAAGAALAAEIEKLAAAESDLAAAEAELAEATAELNDANEALTDAKAELAAAEEAQAAAQATHDEAYAVVKAAADLLGLTVQQFVDANPTLDIVVDLKAARTALDAANASVTSTTAAVAEATEDVASAQSRVDAAAAAVALLKNVIATLQTTIDGLQAVLDAALAALKDVLTAVQAELDALLGAVLAVLDGTPLVSFDRLSVVTEALVTSATEGGQSARVVGGEISGLRVLGTDVLSDVLGTPSVNLLDLVGGSLADVHALIGELTGTLSRVLSTVPAFPTLSVPAPEVGLLTSSAGTDVVDGFGVATTSVTGLSVTVPSISIPAELALPDAGSLGVLSDGHQVTSLLTSDPLTLSLATLSSSSRFAPAVGAPGTETPAAGTSGTETPAAGTPGADTVGVAAPQLPRTGGAEILAVLGVVLMAGAVVARRRASLAEELAG
jgi:predicted  nucleic acid-binding Zn-ribbon protein